MLSLIRFAQDEIAEEVLHHPLNRPSWSREEIPGFAANPKLFMVNLDDAG